VSEHPVDRDHDQKWRKNLQHTERNRCREHLTQVPPLAHHQPGEPSQRERLFLRGGAADATHQQDLSLPELGQTQFIDRDGCLVLRRPRVLQENHIARGVRRHAESRAAVAEQQHERRVGLETKELAPAQPHRFPP
jgi:hypothetical protein